MLKEISISKKVLCLSLKLKVYMDYMAVKRCNDNTQP
jgi:hypothetical protein